MLKKQCLCIDLRSAAQKLTQTYDAAMASSGLSVTQFSQLHLIKSMQGPTLTEMAEASQQDRSTLGRNLKVLQNMGLIITKTGTDARSKTIHLSRKGTNAYKRAAPLWLSVQSTLTARLGIEGRGQLDDLLEALIAPVTINS